MSRRPIRVFEMEFSCIKEACAKFQIQPRTVYFRLKQGLSLREALTFPLNYKNPRCPNGHLLKDENLILVKRTNKSYRQCRTCRNEYQRNYRKQLKAKEQGTNQ